MKYKVGDKVRIRKDLVVGRFYGDMTLLDGYMSSLRGKIAKVTSVVEGHYCVEGLWWSEETLEPVDKKFRLEDYKGKYVMHCNTLEKAKTFCKFLDSKGRRWNGGEKYTNPNCWNSYEEKTCYDFNEGAYCKIDHFKKYNYEILEFDDFEWEDKMKAKLLFEGEEIEVEITKEELEKLRKKKEVNYKDIDKAVDLYRRMLIYSAEHRGNTPDYFDICENKYYIFYSYFSNEPIVGSTTLHRDTFNIFFSSEGEAELAIEEFKDELKWYFTEFEDSL